MEVRITKLRVAMAALFVLAGVGLASLLSPLVGTALATVGQVVNISDHSGSAFFAKVDSDREAGCRGRRRAAERGRNGRGSPGCARVSVACKRRTSRTAASCHRRAERVADQRHQPVHLDRRRERKRRRRLVCTATTCRAAPRVAAARLRRHPLGHPRPGRRRDAALVHLPDAAAVEATRKHEGVPVRELPRTTVLDDDERGRLLRRLTTRNRAGVPGRVRLSMEFCTDIPPED